MKIKIFYLLYMLYLNYFISAILLLLIILITYYVKKKSIIYFIVILLILLILNCILKKKKEFFNVNETAELLRESAEKDSKMEKMNSKMTKLENNIGDLTDIVKQQRVKELYKKNTQAKDFDMTKSQEKQDNELDFLEREIDILTKMYKNEVDMLEGKTVSSIPVLSSCKVKNEGNLYKKGNGDESQTENLIKKIENIEKLKNNGVQSETSNSLYNLISKDKISDNMDINVNLL